jgi:dipeptidyl aminopeptidase/acylaminoacyl peptidase
MRYRLIAACLALSNLVFAQPAVKGRKLTAEDYYRITTVGSAQLSPSGAWVAFTVSTRFEEDNTTGVETYVVRSDGSAAPRKIQHEGKDVASPRWTDDNLLEYSLNARTNSAVNIPGGEGLDAPGLDGQRGGPAAAGGLWKVAVDTPSATPVKADSRPLGMLSPDGQWRATANDKPRAVTPPAYADEFEKRAFEHFKGRQFDWMRFQQDGQNFPTPDPRLRPAAEITIAPSAGGPSRELTNLGMRPANLAWHPSGHAIAFTADEHWNIEQRYPNPAIYTVSTDGNVGNVTRLTNDGYVWSSLAYSPDGAWLLAERTFGTDMVINQKLGHGGSDDLILFPTSAGSPLNLTEKWDLEPNAPRWSPDGKYIYFTAEKGGTTHLFRVAPRPGALVEQVTHGERRLGSITFDKAMSKIAYTVGTFEAPPEVWVANIDGTGEKQLTHMMDDVVAEIGFSKTDRLKWKSRDGTEIEGWLTFPFGFDRARGPYPLIVVNHGGPHSAVGYAFTFKDQFLAANGYFVFETNFRSSTGYGDAFKWATWGAWGNKDGEDVISGIDYVIKTYPVDPSRVATMGHSYGGFMTNWLIVTYPDRFAAAASGAGISNWLSDYGNADIFVTKETEFLGTPWQEQGIQRMVAQSPLTHADRVRTPTLFISGEADQRVPYEEVEQMYFALRRQGVPAKMIQYAGQPHGISGHWNNVHRMLSELKWFDTYLKKNTAQ